ncbi:putative DnaJ-like protein subfamily C member 22 [Hypsibius exemplaris]|uniref:DnaJ homolog subfamily C member 22 n=1 Tax=Hypsibius exemplaris TaxID=2072580 RepID=A0A9X6NKF0_HYPEX|nr:putative DnaJ-like protein subfamily C member 22 [Hypsibius exemplaris]
MAKSTWKAYFLWLTGGLFGLHHFYLGRDRHAFTWFSTLGGVFGLGWLREFTRIPAYVREANQEKEYVEKRFLEMRTRQRPPYNATRVAGELIMGTLFGYLLSLAIPSAEEHEVWNRWASLLVPFAVATGVHLVGNIGMECGKFRWPLLGAYLAAPFFAYNPNSVAYSAVAAAFLFNWRSRDYVRQPKTGLRKRFLYRVSVLSTCGILYLSLWGSFLWFNAKFTSRDGTTTTFREGVDNFLHSKAWLDLKKTLIYSWDYMQHYGWQRVLNEFWESMDTHGESRAMDILGLDSDATQQDMTTRYRKLSREWHPDRHRDPVAKEAAQKMFIEVAQAYEKLSTIRANRAKAGRKSRSDSRDEL